MSAERGSFWSRSWRPSRVARSSGPDFGDMGTAFGLDASFDASGDASIDALPNPESPPPRTEPPLLESLWAINRLNGRSVI